MGAIIGIGAGLGLVVGLLMLDNLTLGLLAGAGVGTVVGAIWESARVGRSD